MFSIALLTGPCRAGFLATLIVLPIMLPSLAAEADKPLVRGQHRIDVPAIGDGLCLHNLFQSNMVLQRDKPIRIWGWAEPGEKVTVAIGGNEQDATAATDRTWAVSLPAMAASSKPATMVVKGKSVTLTLDNILIGDVWLLGGQSNMEHPLARSEDGDLQIVSAHHPGLRILTIPQQNGPEEKKGFPRLQEWHDFFNTHYPRGDWDLCTPKVADELSAIGYAFAQRVHLASRIPIGVIDVSRGGTSLETWLPMSVLKATDTPEVKACLAGWEAKAAAFDPQKDLETRIRQHEQRIAQMRKDGRNLPADQATPPTDLRGGPIMEYNYPGNCYASMIAPIAGLQVKGAIWHQGYTNASQAEGHVMYHQLFGRMIEAWRSAFNHPEMAFGIISMPTEGPQQTLGNFTEMMVNEGQYIRAAQFQTFLDYEKAGDRNVGYASSYDMRRSWYHPQLKLPVGERMARWALATQYGMQIDWRPPVITGVKAGEGDITLTFDVPVAGLSDYPIEGFAIAGKDRRFQPATALHRVTGKDAKGNPVIDMKTLVLTSPHVSDPVHFRYAWGRNPMGNLLPKFSKSGAPLATVRSDDWRIHETPVRFGATADRQSLNLAREAGRLIDMDRRLKDAKRLLEEHQQKHAAEMEQWNSRWRDKAPE